MIATAGNSDGLHDATFMRLPSSPSLQIQARHIVKLSYPANDTSHPKPGLDYTLLCRGDEIKRRISEPPHSPPLGDGNEDREQGGDRMRRRDLIYGTAGVITAWRAGAQEAPKSARIGFVVTNAAYPRRRFDEAMARLGWVEGHNLTVERRITGGIGSSAKPRPSSWSRQILRSSSPPELPMRCRSMPRRARCRSS